MKLLISGATGFIGKHLVKKLHEKGHDVYIVVRKTSQSDFPVSKNHVYVYDTVTELVTFMKKVNFDGVVHLASLFLASHKDEDVENLISSNILFATALLDATTKSNIPWFINTGTFCQHYKNKKYSPVNLYAATKQAFENIVTYYRETTNTKIVTIKLFDTFGEGDTRPKLFNLWAKISSSGEVLEMSPGKQILDINYIGNVVDGYLKMISLLNSKDAALYNGKSYLISSGERMSLRDLAKLFESVTKRKLNIVWGGRPYRPREVMNPWNKEENIPGWKPKISLKKAIQLFIK